jgi:hypothetical protein
MEESDTDDPALVGEECHIVARSPDGPRGVSPLTAEERDKYANLILLCNVHHKQIDDQVNAFPVDTLLKMKAEHEAWVKKQLGADVQRQQDDETYAGYVDTWVSLMKVDEWLNWTSWMLGFGQPELRDDCKVALEEIGPWLLGRLWPKRYPELEAAFHNFRVVAQDLRGVFLQHAEQLPDGDWRTAKFYHMQEWNPERYRKLADEFHAHVALVQDLTFELTRAANYVCDKVREHVLPTFRRAEGVLLVQMGPSEDLKVHTYRPEYRNGERTNTPYPGLEAFKDIRNNRDFHVG